MLVSVKSEFALTDEAVVIRCKSEREARSALRSEYSKFVDLAELFGKPKALLKYPNCRGNGFEIPAKSQQFEKGRQELMATYGSIITPAVFTEMPLILSPGIRRALDTIAENPGDQWFLHRISADLNRMTQIAATESCQSLIIGATVQQAIGRDRRDYMLPEDLERVRAEIRQQMGLGDSIQIKWRGYSPVTRSNWRRFSYEYTNIELLPDGGFLQLGKCFGAEPIASPVAV